MGPNATDAACQGPKGGVGGRGAPPSALAKAGQRPAGVGAPSPGNLDRPITAKDKGKAPVRPSLRPPRPCAAARHPAPVRRVSERPEGTEGAGPSWAGVAPGPNHWWSGDGWVRWDPPVRASRGGASPGGPRAAVGSAQQRSAAAPPRGGKV